MAGEDRRPDPGLKETLLKEGFRFSFFQAVRLLQLSVPGSAPVGYQGPVAREAVRFKPTLDLAFAASDVVAIRETQGPAGGPAYDVDTTFLSLYGSVSPLPTYFTEDLIQNEQDDACLQREFLDLFHHRAISLLYRVWEKYRYTARFSGDGSDWYSKRLLALLGLDRLPAGHRVPPVRLLGFAGLLSQSPKSAALLQAMLSDYFEGVPVRIDSCVGRWQPVPEDQRNALGVSNCRLGADLTAGDRVWDLSCTFRTALGPLGVDDFMAFLPCGDRMPELRELVDLANGDGLDYEIELSLREDEVPDLQLSGPTARLGWSSWLGRREGMETRVRFFVKGWLHGRGQP